MKIYLKVCVLVLVVSLAVWAYCGTGADKAVGCPAKAQNADKSQCPAKIAPGGCVIMKKSSPDDAVGFALKNYDGKVVNLADYKGKIVVLEWFNYKCPFCVYHYQSKPTMVNLANKYKGKNVQFLSINSTSWQTTEENKAFAEKNKIPYPILDDRKGIVGKAYGATRTPHMFIINEKGKIVYSGALDNAPLGKLPAGYDRVLNFVDLALGELTSGRPVTIQKTREYGCSVKYAKK